MSENVNLQKLLTTEPSRKLQKILENKDYVGLTEYAETTLSVVDLAHIVLYTDITSAKLNAINNPLFPDICLKTAFEKELRTKDLLETSSEMSPCEFSERLAEL